MNLLEPYITKEDGIDHLPEPTVPYYVIAEEGTFLYRGTQIGNALLPDFKKIPSLGKTGYKKGTFIWTAENIPSNIIAQATDYFRRIFNKHGSEAEVLITMHNETHEFRLFVPYQRVTAMGVKSVYEPTHIDRNYTVVGTIHSHCNFGAFHSGTDSGDASDMDGIHFTIGMLQNNPPQIVAMAVMSGKEFHYEDPATIADLDFLAATAPEWWDQYVFPAGVTSEKPKGLRSITQEQWNEFAGIAIKKKDAPAKLNQASHFPRKNTHWSSNQVNQNWRLNKYDDEWSRDWENVYTMDRGNMVPFQPTRESANFNKYARKPLGENLNVLMAMAEDAGLMNDDELDYIRVSNNPHSAFTNIIVEKTQDLNEIIAVLNEKPKKGKK